MKLPQGYMRPSAHTLQAFTPQATGGLTGIYQSMAAYYPSSVNESYSDLCLTSAVQKQCSNSFHLVQMESLECSEEKINLAQMDEGLNLARVTAGETVGEVEERDRVPKGTNGQLASRAQGVNVRLTKMYYAVAKDGEVTAERVERFCSQMSFERRARNLDHGSLVTGYGSWGGPENVPVKLQKLPANLAEIQALFVQWPSTNLIKFITDGPVQIPPIASLPMGGVIQVPIGDGLFEFFHAPDNTFVGRRAQAA